MARNSFPMKLDFTRVQNVTTGAACVLTPLAMGPQTYGVVISALANTWMRFVENNSGGATVASASQTVAAPAVFTTVTQGFTAGTPVYILPSTPGGVAPGGFTLNTIYYVIATGLTTTACQLATTPAGTGVTGTASAPCILQPVGVATATNSVLVKLSDPPMEYGVSPGQFIATLQVAAGAGFNVVELTH